jgi:hypothetical protein
MMNTVRYKLLEKLRIAGEQNPDWRFGQLVSNISGLYGDSVANITDQELLESAEHFLAIQGNGADQQEG